MAQVIRKTKKEVNELFNLYSKIQMLVTNGATQGMSLDQIQTFDLYLFIF